MGSPHGLDLSIDLARRIKAARALSGKKVHELALELGWSDEKLYRLERGVQVPDAFELAAIAATTEQSVDFLLGLAPSAEPQSRRSLPLPLPAVNGEADGA